MEARADAAGVNAVDAPLVHVELVNAGHKHVHELEPGEYRHRALRLPCGHRVTIDAYTVDAAGNVRPSVACPVKPCLGHYLVRLLP